MNDAIRMTGRVGIIERLDGKVVNEEWIDNLVVAGGRELAAARMKDGSLSAITHIAVGSGSLPPQLTDTTLQTELLRKAAASSLNQQTVLYAITLNPGDLVGEISEAGLFNAASGGIMVSRVYYRPRILLPTSSLTIVWALTFS